MTIYVGRWDLRPKDSEGINGLYVSSEQTLKDEIGRQMDTVVEDFCGPDPLVGAYTPAEFEETFNEDAGHLHGLTYFIKFFEDGKSVCCQ